MADKNKNKSNIPKCKVVLLGDEGVWKTSIISRYILIHLIKIQLRQMDVNNQVNFDKKNLSC